MYLTAVVVFFLLFVTFVGGALPVPKLCAKFFAERSCVSKRARRIAFLNLAPSKICLVGRYALCSKYTGII